MHRILLPSESVNIPPGLQALLKKKKLEVDLFAKAKITFDAPVAEHIKLAYQHVYKFPFAKEKPRDPGLPREGHGIQHISRVAMYVEVIANLFFKHRPDLKLNDEDIKLIQLAAIFHDSAREADGVDLWDDESATLLYNYLTKTLDKPIPHEKAKILAEAIANKDDHKDGYHELFLGENGDITWRLSAKRPKNIYQMILHDADCLDVIRARASFDGTFLDFYSHIVLKDQTGAAFDDLAILIMEARALIELHGDTFCRNIISAKKKLENENAYNIILAGIQKFIEKGLLFELFNLQRRDLKPKDIKDDKGKPKNDPLQNLIWKGKVFVRGVEIPNALRDKLARLETLAELEAYKVSRKKGVKTRTNKPDNLNKHGNPNRSVSMIGPNSAVYANAGFMIFDPDVDQVTDIAEVDSASGMGKKRGLKLRKLEKNEKIKKLNDLNRLLKLGGAAKGSAFRHNEILYNVTEYHAIYFTDDPTMCCFPAPTHPSSPLIQAVMLQEAYEKQTGKKLPIYHYSPLFNKVTKIPDQSVVDIVALWQAVCQAHMEKIFMDFEKGLKKDDLMKIKKLQKMTIKEIKIIGLYDRQERIGRKFSDRFHDEKIDFRVDEMVENTRKKLMDGKGNKLIGEYKRTHVDPILETIENNKFVLTPDNFFNLYLFSEAISAPVLVKLGDYLTKELSELKFDAASSLPALIKKSDWKFYKQLLADKELVMEDDPVAEKSLHKNLLLNIYALAKKLNLNVQAERVRQHMRAHILNEIQRINSQFVTHKYSDLRANFERVICAMAMFDLSTPEIKGLVQDAFVRMLQHAQAQVNNLTIDIGGFDALVSDIKKLGFENPQITALIENIARDYGKKIIQANADTPAALENLASYLTIAETVKILFAQRKEVLLKCLDKITISLPDEYVINLLKYKFDILWDDEEVFKRLISRIEYTAPFSEYAIALFSLEVLMFLPWQKELIEKQLNLLANHLVSKIRHAPLQIQFDILSKEAIKYLSARHLMPLPDCIVVKINILIKSLSLSQQHPVVKELLKLYPGMLNHSTTPAPSKLFSSGKSGAKTAEVVSAKPNPKLHN